MLRLMPDPSIVDVVDVVPAPAKFTKSYFGVQLQVCAENLVEHLQVQGPTLVTPRTKLNLNHRVR
jgi:hypothetical protein